MTYKKLSEVMEELSNPQRSDAFVKKFRDAVREGHIDAMNLQVKFDMPKMYSSRGGKPPYKRQAKDMLFEVTPAFTKWFEAANKDLASSRRTTKVKPSLEAVESGAIDFNKAVAETRRKMQASYEKGQALGNSRARTRRKR